MRRRVKVYGGLAELCNFHIKQLAAAYKAELIRPLELLVSKSHFNIFPKVNIFYQARIA